MIFKSFLPLFFFSCSVFSQELVYKKEVLLLMGSRFEFVASHVDKNVVDSAILKGIDEVRRLEKMISSWDTSSQTSQVNEMAGIRPVKVDKELFELVRRSLKISKLTDGVFDISYASMDKIWKFDGSMTTFPDSNLVAQSVSKISYENILLNEKDQTIFLKNEGMKIGFGAIGKGFAANKAKNIMQQLGIQNGMVNAGGDLLAWGTNQNNIPWTIKIGDPDKKVSHIAEISIDNQAVVTSGNYEKFVIFDDVKYSHIIHPKTGLPVKGIKSVTIFCPDAELADALATSVFIMGVQSGLALIEQLHLIDVIIIDDNNEWYSSSGINLKQ